MSAFKWAVASAVILTACGGRYDASEPGCSDCASELLRGGHESEGKRDPGRGHEGASGRAGSGGAAGSQGVAGACAAGSAGAGVAGGGESGAGGMGAAGSGGTGVSGSGDAGSSGAPSGGSESGGSGGGADLQLCAQVCDHASSVCSDLSTCVTDFCSGYAISPACVDEFSAFLECASTAPLDEFVCQQGKPLYNAPTCLGQLSAFADCANGG